MKNKIIKNIVVALLVLPALSFAAGPPASKNKAAKPPKSSAPKTKVYCYVNKEGTRECGNTYTDSGNVDKQVIKDGRVVSVIEKQKTPEEAELEKQKLMAAAELEKQKESQKSYDRYLATYSNVSQFQEKIDFNNSMYESTRGLQQDNLDALLKIKKDLTEGKQKSITTTEIIFETIAKEEPKTKNSKTKEPKVKEPKEKEEKNKEKDPKEKQTKTKESKTKESKTKEPPKQKQTIKKIVYTLDNIDTYIKDQQSYMERFKTNHETATLKIEKDMQRFKELKGLN